MTPAETTAQLRILAATLRFDLVGVAPAGPLPRASHYKNWLALGYGGGMAYLARHSTLRADSASLVPGATSVICAAMSYHQPDSDEKPPPGSVTGRVARYARGADYHIVLRERLERLLAGLRVVVDQTFDARIAVDTAPILERDVAAQAGIGWVGKNTLVLNRRRGSYLLLGEIVTTLPLAADAPETDHCGSCTRCLDACPTSAFAGPYVLNASRCISYLTIEHRGEVPEQLAAGISDWIYGCDICQEVCPFNHKATPGRDLKLNEPRIPARIPAAEILQARAEAIRVLTRGSAAARAKPAMWRRNAALVLGGAQQLSGPERAALLQACHDDDAGVRGAARWAARRHGLPIEEAR